MWCVLLLTDNYNHFIFPHVLNVSPLCLEDVQHGPEEQVVELHLQLLHGEGLLLHGGPSHPGQADVLGPVIAHIAQGHPGAGHSPNHTRLYPQRL